MDHAEAIELLELAAVEPDGLDRLVAGDTHDAGLLAGHLAACPSCTAEFAGLRRTATLVRSALRDEGAAVAVLPDAGPPADLRERTLAFVREVGSPRGSRVGVGAAAVGAEAAGVGAAGDVAQPALARPAAEDAGVIDIGRRGSANTRRRSPSRAWWAAAAAVVLVATGLTGAVIGGTSQATIARQQATTDALAQVNAWALRLAGTPDARSITLADATGSGKGGKLLLSPSRSELLVVMDGVTEPPAGSTYQCWIEVAGVRHRVGRMWFGGDVGYWAGWVDGLSAWPAGATFGVSLVTAGAGGAGTGGVPPIMSGTL